MKDRTMTSRRVLRAAAVRDSWSWEGPFSGWRCRKPRRAWCRAGFGGRAVAVSSAMAVRAGRRSWACQARFGRRRNRAAPAPSATMPRPAAVVTCWEPWRLWPWTWRWPAAAPAAMAAAALNRNRNQSTGLRLSRAVMTFFLPGWGAVDGAGCGLAGVTGVQLSGADMTFFLPGTGAGWSDAGV